MTEPRWKSPIPCEVTEVRLLAAPRRLTIGFLDVSAVSMGLVKLVSELSDELRALARERADPGSIVQGASGLHFTIGGGSGTMAVSTVCVSWWSLSLNVPAVRLALAAKDFGCVVADIAHAKVVTRAELERCIS